MFKRKAFYIGPLRVKLILACQECLNGFGPINQNKLLFIHILTLLPSMQYKWKEIIDFVCKTTTGKW